MKRIRIVFFLGLLFWRGPAYASDFSTSWDAVIYSVHDGDTVTVMDANNQKHRVRLYGIDCPEIGQPWGEEARQYAQQLFAPREKVKIQAQRRKDKYKRTVAIVVLSNGHTAQDYILDAGLAWVYERYCRDDICSQWQMLETNAKNQEMGIWGDRQAISPWEWRKNKQKKRQ